MVTNGSNVSFLKTATFIAGYTSLGRKRDRWCITIPKDVSGLLDKRRIVQVRLRPLGTIG